jgi:hypothetical protein
VVEVFLYEKDPEPIVLLIIPTILWTETEPAIMYDIISATRRKTMTTREMVTELSASLGNRTDITNARYIQWLNWSLFDVCGQHRRRSQNSRTFSQLERSINLIAGNVIEGAYGLTSTYGSEFTLPELYGRPEEDVVDFYKDAIITFTGYDTVSAGQEAPAGLVGQVFTIRQYDHTSRQIDTTPYTTILPDVYTEFAIYRRIWSLNQGFYFGMANRSGVSVSANSRTDIWGIQRLECISGGFEAVLEMKSWEDIIGLPSTTLGTPTAFAHHGENIIFDVTPDGDYTYRLWYYAYPTLMTETNIDGICDLPPYWHEAVVAGAVYRGFAKLMEPDRAAQALAAYTNIITNSIDEDELENGQITHSFRLRR